MGNFSASALFLCTFGTTWALCFLLTCGVGLDFFYYSPLLETKRYY